MRLHNTGIRIVAIAGHNIGPNKTSPEIRDRPFSRGGERLSLHTLIEEAPIVRSGVVRIVRDPRYRDSDREEAPPLAPPAPPGPSASLPPAPTAPPAPPPPPPPKA